MKRIGFVAIPALVLAWADKAEAVQLRYVDALRVNTLGAEIVTVQSSSGTIVVTEGEQGDVVFMSLQDNALQKQQRFKVTKQGEELTSSSVHPEKPWVAISVANNNPAIKGRVRLIDWQSQKTLFDIETGYHSDAVVFSPEGNAVLVANEGEQYAWDVKHQQLYSQPGSVSYISLDNLKVTAVPVVGEAFSAVSNHDRYLERSVAIVNGKKGKTVLGRSEVKNIKSIETLPSMMLQNTTRAIHELPLLGESALQYEPEYIAFSSNSQTAYVSFQENNFIGVLNVASLQWDAVFDLGVSSHVADTKDNGKVSFTDAFTAYREPDGICLLGDQYLVSADEGDTEPKASKTPKGTPAGGARTVSVFDIHTGKLLADSGNSIDASAHEIGIYPDKRSDSKGSEPESVACFEHDGKWMVAATLERANGIALFEFQGNSLSLVAIEALQPEAKNHGPEGIATWQQDGDRYIAVASEKSGYLSVYQVE